MPTGQRLRILGGCHLRSFLHWQTWAGLLLATALAMVGQISVRYSFPAFTSRQAPLMGFSGAVVGWIVGGHISWKIRVGVVRKLLHARFPHLCPECGYDLRHSAGRCPECGTEKEIPRAMAA